MRDLLPRIIPGTAALAAILAAGTIGYSLLEDLSPFDAFFETVSVISTLGCGTQRPLTTAGKALTIGLIITGVGTLYYLLVGTAETLIEARIGLSKGRRLKQRIGELADHAIVCGYGRVGSEVVRELRVEGIPFVVIDPDPARIKELIDAGESAITEDASSDEVLSSAGIDRARGLVVCTGSDAMNVFITLSARFLNERLIIVARAIREEDEPKLLRAGASRAITPASLGGRRLAALIAHPASVDLLDTLVGSGELRASMREIRVDEHPDLRDRTIGGCALGSRMNITVLAIKRAEGQLIANPPSETPLRAGDVVIALANQATSTAPTT